MDWRRLLPGNGGGRNEGAGDASHHPDDLWHDYDKPFIQLHGTNYIRWRHLYAGTFILGRTGSGKTSGSAMAYIRNLLMGQTGGLVLCASKFDAPMWMRLAKAYGREADIIRITPQSIRDAAHGTRLNPIGYELSRAPDGEGEIANVVTFFDLMKSVMEGNRTQSDENDFFDNAAKQLLRNALELLRLSGSEMTFASLLQIVLDAPRNVDQATHLHHAEDDLAAVEDRIAQKEAAGVSGATLAADRQEQFRLQQLIQTIQAWEARSFTSDCLKAAMLRVGNDPSKKADWNAVDRYWRRFFAPLADRTRTSVESTLIAMMRHVDYGLARDFFTQDTTFTPEQTWEEGKIILLDLPPDDHQEVGRFIQTIFKVLYQRAVMRRNIKKDFRPVFLMADEAQNFLTPLDYRFQAEARKYRVISVYITQTISGMQTLLESRSNVEALAGNLVTTIMHNQIDDTSKQWMSRKIGSRYVYIPGMSHNLLTPDGNLNLSQQERFKVLPDEYTHLRTGGKNNHYQVDAIVFNADMVFSNTRDHYSRVAFTQMPDDAVEDTKRKQAAAG